MNPVSVSIRFLADTKEIIPQLVEWAYLQWGSEGVTPEYLIKEYASFARRDSLPLSLVAWMGIHPVGVVSLKLHEMSIYRDKPHWLGGLLVIPQCRGRGIGSALVQHALSVASQLGVRVLYLNTTSHVRFYSTAGFEKLEQI